MRKICIILAIWAAAFLSACTSARVTTEINKDGSFKRNVALTGSVPQQGMTMTGATTIEEAFVVPSGNGWKLVPNQEKRTAVSAVSVPPANGGSSTDSKSTKTFERVFAAGSPAKGDLSLKVGKSAPGQLQLVNEATVTAVGPNRYEYKEVLRWVGRAPDPPTFSSEQLADVRAQLPAAIATDANARGLAERAYKLMLPTLFGPGDPLLATGFLHPDLAAHRIMQKIGGSLLKAIEEQFGDKLTPDERRELAKRLITRTLDSTKPSQPDPMSPPSDKKDSNGLTPLTFIVHAPGKLISTNGEYDELTGEVFWGMYPEAASYQPVVLTAVFELK